MKKQTKEKEFIPSKWTYLIFFTFPLLMSLLMIKNLDNDIWYLLSEGRYIVENGIYYIDPLSMHTGLQVIVQNWASAALLWILYSGFGEFGIITLVLICNFLICLLLYKICKLISDNNRVLSLVIMFLTTTLLSLHFIVSRPQVISFVILLSVIYVLELYIKTGKSKYLTWIPILSFLEMNLHASLWWMIFLFALPYVIDSFNIPLLKTQGYKKKPLFIALGIAFVVGLFNPYFYKGITFIFTSFTDKYMHIYINELLPFSFNNMLSKQMFFLALIVGLLYAFFREGNIRVRYLCLFAGTMLLGFMSVKGFSHFILVSLFPLAYFFKDMFPKDFNDLGDFGKVIKIIIACFACLALTAFSYFYATAPKRLELKNDAAGAMDVLEKSWSKNTSKVYSSFNNGGYVEFRGFKPYIDPRAEVYLKVNNKKADIFKENYKLQHGQINIKKWLKKYKFTHLLVQNSDILYKKLENNKNYIIVYEDTDKGYRLYASKDLFTSDQLESMEEDYNSAIKEAKENSNKKVD